MNHERPRPIYIFQSTLQSRDQLLTFNAGDVFQPVFVDWFGDDSALSDRRYILLQCQPILDLRFLFLFPDGAYNLLIMKSPVIHVYCCLLADL